MLRNAANLIACRNYYYTRLLSVQRELPCGVIYAYSYHLNCTLHTPPWGSKKKKLWVIYAEKVPKK